jgi:hypothetical protein
MQTWFEFLGALLVIALPLWLAYILLGLRSPEHGRQGRRCIFRQRCGKRSPR